MEYDHDGPGGDPGVQVMAFEYDNGNRESKRTYGNGIVTNRTYKSGENLVEDISVPGYAALSVSYGYDANHNVTAETYPTGLMDDYSFTAGYDDENRLTGWQRASGRTQSWDLSPVGNWDEFTEDMTTQVRSHNDVHELTAIDTDPLTYDSKGNLTGNTHAYAWDFDNMLSTATVPASPTQGTAGSHTYENDALGRRVAKTVTHETEPMSPVTTKTLFINSYELLPPLGTVGGQVLAEYEKFGTGNYALARTYCYGEYVDEPLTLIDYTDLGSVSAGDPETFYYHHNRVFHVIGLTDESDDVVELYTYTPYGQVETLAPSLNPRGESAFGNRYLFTGRSLDAETGMFYFRARYFDAVLGRFTSRDPAGYYEGPLLYIANFAPGRLDPSGLHMLPGNSPVHPTADTSSNSQWGNCNGVPFNYRRDCWVRNPNCVYADQSNNYCMMLDPNPDACFLRFLGNCPTPRGRTPGFHLCQRDIIESDFWDECANSLGGQHQYIQFGSVDNDGNPVDDSTEGWGIGGGSAGQNPSQELAFRPTRCWPLNRTDNALQNGSGAGRPGTNASDAEILDCISNMPMTRSHHWRSYNCTHWARQAIEGCGLTR